MTTSPTSSSRNTRCRSGRPRCTTQGITVLTDAQDARVAREPDGPDHEGRQPRLRAGGRRPLQPARHHGPPGHGRRPRLRRHAFESQHRRQARGGGRGQLDQLVNMGTWIPPADTSPRTAGSRAESASPTASSPGLDGGAPDARQLGLLPRHDERSRAPRAAGPEPAAVRSPSSNRAWASSTSRRTTSCCILRDGS